ncbi:glycoside hydrolase family 16 protein [Motilibacter sp. K478]|nr:glycoside hydrolase family 16 protein [Motilibacter aurantiacus]NHC47021.1 glycoside hydrolase family 16 protein [Motilibacter aurantiacus]
MPPGRSRLAFADEFDAPTLDRSVWLPHYLPAWSSRARSAATYEIEGSCLRLSIPPGQRVWCAGDHTPPLRVSAVQSASRSGPVGSTRGQQPYRPGLTVREEQPSFVGWAPDSGYVAIRARGVVSARSMVAFWLVGLEDVPERSAEVCVAEMFGHAVVPGRSTAVGTGLHAFRDPEVREDFAALDLPLDVSEFHVYGADRTDGRVDFYVDGELVRTCTGAPSYPMQLMIGVFDFPERSTGDDAAAVPELIVDWVRGYL